MSQNISEKILLLLNSKIFCLGDLMLDKYINKNSGALFPANKKTYLKKQISIIK